jgi:spore coat-associated protein N
MRGISPRSLTTATPQRMLTALGGLIIATAVAVGSGANFNATSATPGNLITAGTLVITNSLPGSSILTAAALKPGASTSGTVTITNGGNLPATFTLAPTGLTDTPTSPAFSAKLTLQLQDLGDPACGSGCPAPVTIYSGALGAMAAQTLGVFAAGASHKYRFTVTFPDGGAGGADNGYGGASTNVTYQWTATQ